MGEVGEEGEGGEEVGVGVELGDWAGEWELDNQRREKEEGYC